MAQHNKLGEIGEQLAAEYLMKKGYTIRETNWRAGHDEIDIVAQHNANLVVVEVKTRSDDFIDPLLAINRKKISNLVKAARAYMSQAEVTMPVQFDIITIVGTPDDYKIEHFADAFYPPLRTY